MAINIGDLIATLSLDDRLSKGLMAAGEATANLGKGMMVAGGAATALGGAVLAAIGPSIKAAADYETAMNKIKALTIASSEDVAKWGRDILQLSTVVGKSPKELGDALYFIASSGQTGATGFEILTTSAKMAALGMGQTEEIARALVSAVNAYGPANLSAAQAGDILTRSVIEGGAQADEYAAVLGRILPIASALGVGLDEIGAFMATFTRLGVKGSEAATALRGALSALAAPGKQASEALAALGLSGEILRQKLSDEGLVSVLELLMEKTKGNIGELDKIIPNIRALTGVLGVAGKQGGEYARILGTIKDSHGQLESAFGEWGKTTAAQWAQLQAALQSAAVELGTALLPLVKEIIPYLKSMAEAVRDAIKWFAGLSEGTRTLIGNLLLFGGPALLAVGAMVTMLGQLGMAIAALSMGGPILAGIGTAIGAVVLAIGTLVIVEQATAWFLDLVPGVRALTTAFVDLAMQATGAQWVLNAYNDHLKKGKEASAGWTEAERAAYNAHVQSLGARASAGAALAKQTQATDKLAAATKGATAVEKAAKSITDADVAAKLRAKTTTETLAKATTAYGEVVTDIVLAKRILAIEEATSEAGMKKSAEAAKKAKEETARLNYELAGQAFALDQSTESLNRYLAVWVDFKPLDLTADIAALNEALGEGPPMADVLGPAIAQGARDAAKALDKVGQKVRDIRFQGLIEGFAIFAGMIGGDAGAMIQTLGNIGREFAEIGKMEAGAAKNAALLNAALTALGEIGAMLSNSTTPAVQKFGGALQGAAAGAKLGTAILPGWGTAIGGIVGGIFGFINAGQKLRKELEGIKTEFVKSMGGLDELKLKALQAGVSIEEIFKAKSKNTLLAAIDEVKAKLELWGEANEKLQAAIEKYGITVSELGPKFAQQQMDKRALDLVQDWKLLAAAGVQVATLVEKMGPDMAKFVEESLKAGTKIPFAMKPMIDALWQAGKLLHEDGTAFTEAEYKALSFGGTTAEMFDKLLEKIDKLVNALLGIPDVDVNVNVNTDWSEEGGAPGRPKGGGEIPSYMTGGIAMRPTLAYVAENGPEAIVPLDEWTAAKGGPTINVYPSFEENPLQTYEARQQLRDHTIQTLYEEASRGLAAAVATGQA
jgi:TP901 family phage tail tape measure protein